MAQNACEMYFNGIKIACFFQKITQLLADPRLWYVWVTLVYSKRLPNLDIFTFNFGKPDNGFWFFVLQNLCPTKSSSFKNFWWRHYMSFVVLPPPIKNPGYAYGLTVI